MYRRKLEELNLLDDFLFNAMLTYPKLGEEFTRKILKCLFGREFRKLRVIAQKSYGGMNTDLRGARLDVYVEEADSAAIDAENVPSVYDLEPDQNDKEKLIAVFPKRVRFYHAIIDSRSLKSGEDFGKLKNVYVIFICNYDPFGYDRVKYTIRNMCEEELGMPYEDGAKTIVLNTKGTKGEITKELRELLQYMEYTTPDNAVNDTLKELQEMVEQVKRDGEVSLSYMKGFERDTLMYEKGAEEGRREERKNTERERRRADFAEKARQKAEEARRKEQEARRKEQEARRKEQEARHKEQELSRMEAEKAFAKIAELEARLKKYQG